jgi:short chain dehydrogenase
MACRSKERAESAKSDLISELHSGGVSTPKLEFMALDLCDTLSVRHFVKAFKAKYDRLDILCNNAGLNSDGMTAQGLSITWAANFQGHFLLTDLLYNTIKKTPNARVVNLSSMMHHFGSTEWHKSALGTRPEGLMRPFYARSPYADTKMAMVLLTQVCDSLLYVLLHYSSTRYAVLASAYVLRQCCLHCSSQLRLLVVCTANAPYRSCVGALQRMAAVLQALLSTLVLCTVTYGAQYLHFLQLQQRLS